MISFIKDNNNNWSVLVNGALHNFDSTHRRYNELKQAILDEDESTLVTLLATNSFKDWSDGVFTVTPDKTYYHNIEVDPYIHKLIVKCFKENLEVKYLLNFVKNLYINTSDRVIKELLPFLQMHNISITDDGHFLAYKGLSGDYKDVWTGKVDNSIGVINYMHRKDVNDDKTVCAAGGYHVGSYAYAKNYSRGQLVICKVSPADVVCVPEEFDLGKIRTCKYEVLCDCTKELEIGVYSAEELKQDEQGYETSYSD